MNKPLHQALVSHLLNNVADADVIVELHNEHAPADAFIYNSIEDIAELINTDDDAAKIASMVFFGNVPSWNARFFCLNDCENIDGFNSLTDDLSPVDYELLAAQIIASEQFDDVGFDADFYLSDDE